MAVNLSEVTAGENAMYVVERLWKDFPGLRDGETDINGGDLVDAVTYMIRENDQLKSWLRDHVTVQFENHYSCAECACEWNDRHTCECDDRCPECDTAYIPAESLPRTSADLGE